MMFDRLCNFLILFIFGFIFAFMFTIVLLLMFSSVGRAQSTTHESGHAMYLYWQSKATKNCCNDEDCHPLAPNEWKEDNDGFAVLVAQQWCRVGPEHFLIRGR